MMKSVATLKKMGHICQINDGQWLFKALLAPKPHQEHIQNIEDFVWRFCVNGIPLNQVARLIAYPISCCDDAVENAFKGLWMWLYNAIMGYHQLAVPHECQEKLAFYGPNAIKWTYTIMHFGPTNANGPANFIMMIHNVVSKGVDYNFGINISANGQTH